MLASQREKSGYDGELDVDAHLSPPAARGGGRGGRGSGRGGRDGGAALLAAQQPAAHQKAPCACQLRKHSACSFAWVAVLVGGMCPCKEPAPGSLPIFVSADCSADCSGGQSLVGFCGQCAGGGGRGSAAKRTAKDSKYGFGGPKRAGEHPPICGHANTIATTARL